MRIVRGDCYCPSLDTVEEAVEVIERGGLVVAPTDTVYGLLADPLNPKALEKVYALKGRDPGKPVPILLGESHHALLLVEPGELFWRLALAYWPGPLTIVEKPMNSIPQHLKPWGKIGVRLPNCQLVREIARKVGGLLVGTSANKSGRASPRTVHDALVQLGKGVDLYIDGGSLARGVPSTVVDVSTDKITVLRAGAISEDDIRRILE